MSLNTLKALLGNYCDSCQQIEKGDNWASAHQNDRKTLGSKANLLEEIIYEARKLKPADARGPVWRNNVDRRSMNNVDRRSMNNVDRQQNIVRRIQPGPEIIVPSGQMPRINVTRRDVNPVRRIQPGPEIIVPPGRMPRINVPQQVGGSCKSCQSRKVRKSVRKTRSN